MNRLSTYYKNRKHYLEKKSQGLCTIHSCMNPHHTNSVLCEMHYMIRKKNRMKTRVVRPNWISV